MDDFKFLPFYKLYDWMLYELGASTDAAIIAIIYSFEENKLKCEISYATFAKILQITRCNAISRIDRLIRAGYLKVTVNGTNTNTYTVNKSAFSSIENDTSCESTSIENNTSTSIENNTSTSIENDTSASIENDTQIENIKEKLKRIEKRGGKGSGKAAAAPAPLTDEQKNHIRYGFRYDTPKNTRKHTADYYIRKAETIGYEKTLEYMADDLEPLTDEQEQQNRDYALSLEQIQNQSGMVQLKLTGKWVEGYRGNDGYIHTPDGKTLSDSGDEMF